MSHSNTNVEQLGEAYKACAATAKSMGYSVEETTAVLATMANAGVKGGEAGTALNAIMTRLATNTKGCADELKKYGVSFRESCCFLSLICCSMAALRSINCGSSI